MKKSNQIAVPAADTKEKLALVGIKAVDSILEKGNVLEVAENFAKVGALIEVVKKDPRFIDAVRTEIGKHGKSLELPNGIKLAQIEAGTEYVYTNCNDPELVELEAAAKLAKEKLKARQEFLQKVPAAGMDIITKDGEAIKVYPPYKTSTSTFSTSIPNK